MDVPHLDSRRDREAFHVGERLIQARFGVRDRLAETSARVIRPRMPEQHRAFFAHLPYVLVGAHDDAGLLWASILLGPEGFIASPDPELLCIDALPPRSDALIGALRPGAAIGVLGIDLTTRRRNRANDHILRSADQASLRIGGEQSFGNCPQYIWPRKPGGPTIFAGTAQPGAGYWLQPDDERVRRLIAGADTFFVASRYRDSESGAAGEVDVSHRGGRAGFLQNYGGSII